MLVYVNVFIVFFIFETSERSTWGHVQYLDEVIVETETCEQPRAPNSQSQQA